MTSDSHLIKMLYAPRKMALPLIVVEPPTPTIVVDPPAVVLKKTSHLPSSSHLMAGKQVTDERIPFRCRERECYHPSRK